MHDFLCVAFRKRLLAWDFSETLEAQKLAVENSLVKVECFFGIAREVELRGNGNHG